MSRERMFLKNKEQEIVLSAYKIALIKQDIALFVMDVVANKVSVELKSYSSQIEDRIFTEVEKIPNSRIQRYIDAPYSEKESILLELLKELSALILVET